MADLNFWGVGEIKIWEGLKLRRELKGAFRAGFIGG
jgi:hypothetical protein